MALSDTGKNKVQEIRRVKIEFVAEEGVAKMIERAKELLRHKYPEGKLEDLVREAFELLLDKKDPERMSSRAKREILNQEIPRFARNDTDTRNDTDVRGDRKTRYISRETKLKVYKRDEGRCSYVSLEGKRCGERNFLELDHVHPWGLGGDSTTENLRLLCRPHNQWRSSKTFGKTFS